MSKQRVITALAISVLTTLSVSAAPFVSRDWMESNDDLLTFDYASHLEWLDLPLTQGANPPTYDATISHREVLAELGPGGRYAGFRVPTQAEVDALFVGFGLPVPTGVEFIYADDYQAGIAFVEYFGQTGLLGWPDPYAASMGRIELDSGALVAYEVQVIPSTDSTAPPGLPPGLTLARVRYEHVGLDSTGGFGSFLVREAPFTDLPCVYSFGSGAGASLIQHCVSANGTIVQLQAPAGQQHINVGQTWEGFVVCSGTTVQAWDLTATESGFGTPTVVKGPSATSVTLRRSSDKYQLDQMFTLDKKEKDVTITMTLTNISGAMIPDVRIARAYDPDPNNDFGDDFEVKSARGVWAGDVDAVTLTGTTWAFPTDTAIDTGPGEACSPSGAPSPTTTSDASLANVTYRVGNMAAGAKKKVTFVYRTQ